MDLAGLARTMRRWRGRGMVVAVSGGSDSVGLLRILADLRQEFDLKLSVAHLDHGTRGEASKQDAAFVADLAGSLGLPFDLGHWQPSRPNHFEADARSARYAWLTQMARQRNASLVAVGHTRDDQAETILHRVLRGTGPRGLAGMPRARKLADGVTLVRPLLEVSRDAIRSHLAAIGQPFREDASNADTRRTRSRLRHDLLPRLAAEYNPRVAEALTRLGSLARSAERSRGLRLRKLERLAIASESDAGITFRGPILTSLPPFLSAELLRRAWRRQNWPEREIDRAAWQRLAEAASGPDRRVEVPGGIILDRSGEAVFLGPPPAAIPTPSPIPLDIPGAARWGSLQIAAETDPDAPRDETIDLDALSPPLRVAPADLSERFDPLGMAGQTQALGEFLRGRRIRPRDRASAVVVRDEKGIVWVIGHRIADRVKLTPATSRTLGLRRDRT